MTTYISSLGSADPALAQRIAQEWLALVREGAHDGAISLFTADPAACTAELGATSKTMAETSFVAAFADEGQAERAWEAGVLGFVPPARGESPAGLTRGTDTGLGLSAWTYVRPPVRLASWHKSVFVAVVVLTNLDPTAFKGATGLVDARLN
jgi:hypothetical protein